MKPNDELWFLDGTFWMVIIILLLLAYTYPG